MLVNNKKKKNKLILKHTIIKTVNDNIPKLK